MDRYGNATAISTDEEEDEPFYCSPICADKNVIWPGSDSEQTVEEIEQKRLRYEHHARRYLRGYQPVLQSTTLRGPLSGWINPWRWVPPAAKEDDWWQPGSEDMLFTREKVMKRAADHGLGYLGPSEALAWCKASAQAEAGRINKEESVERDTQAEIGNTLVVLDANESPLDPPTKSELIKSDTIDPYEEHSMVNHNSETPRTTEPANEEVRSKKRHIDSQWLEGSYVSKRARWDGPAIATPTPQPDMGERHRRRVQSFPKRNGSNTRTSTEPSRRSVSFADMTSAQKQMEVNLNPAMPSTAPLDYGQAPGTSPPGTTFRRSAPLRNDGALQPQEDEIDELHTESQESIFTSSSRKRSHKKYHGRSRGFTNTSVLDVQPDDLNAITPRQPSLPSKLSSGHTKQNDTLRSRSNRLPKLRKSTPLAYDSENPHEAAAGDEYSFVTEVALSSRDLEMFQYRKKRKRIGSEALNPNPNDSGVKKDLRETPRMASEPGTDDQAEHLSDYRGSMAPDNIERTEVSLHVDSAPIPEDEVKYRSDLFDESWDLMEDAIQQPPDSSALSEPPVQTISPKQLPHTHISPIPTKVSQPFASWPKTGSSRSEQSSRSSPSHPLQSLPNLRKNSGGLPAVGMRVGISQDPNDRSTQSYNTSPPRPILNPPSELSSQTSPDNIQCGATSSSFKGVQDMGVVQKRYSQPCTSFTSPVITSDNHRGSEISDRMEMGVESAHDLRLNRSRGIPSSGSNGSSQKPGKGDNVTMRCAVDKVPGAPAVSRTQRTEHTPEAHRILQEKLARAEHMGVEGKPEASVKLFTTRPMSPAQDSCPIGVNGQQVQNGISSDNASREAKRDETSMSRALRDSPGPKDAGSSFAKIDSETSWEGCGHQSPWAGENPESLHMTWQNSHSGLMNSSPSPMNGTGKGAVSLENWLFSGERDWDHLERPLTPQNEVVKPFKDLMSPTTGPEATNAYLEGDGLPNTQLLVTAATNNPWTSTLRNPSSKKSQKRVSFGILPSEEKENSQPNTFDKCAHSKKIPGSPPPPHLDADEDIFNDGIARNVPKFVRHFVAAKQLSYILPQNQGSPLNSSPPLSAQAEAFIAADRQAPGEQQRSRLSSRSPSRNPNPGRGRIEEDPWLRERSSESLKSSPKLPENNLGNLVASFDMEDALGVMSDFLEDWSVDAELKKAKGSKESESSGCRESNGHKRRRLFGLA
jgi:hypothetical protein